MPRYVLDLTDIDKTQVAAAGGKGAHLGELSRIAGVRVPSGFCVTTAAFQRVMALAPSTDKRLDRLSRLEPDDTAAIRALSAELRQTIESIAIPDNVADELICQLESEEPAFAVRSSATAEDLPTTSFAGQHDSYLNVVGSASILRHVSRCWASLFTDRAVIYRLRNGVDHRTVHMAVVVQRMVLPYASGVLFTADPVSGNRTVASIEATLGLGEALVSGVVNPDAYLVRNGEVTSKHVRQRQPVLTDAQVVRLDQIGRRIEAHFGSPQDIEWCLANDAFHIVQSRPITTLFPIPAADDRENHVYVSVGHQQMMTDAMKPLGISVRQLTARVPMLEAGGRWFVDVTEHLSSSDGRAWLLGQLGRSDPLIRDALQTIVDRGDYVRQLADSDPTKPPAGAKEAPLPADPGIVAELVARSEASIDTLKHEIRGKAGPELLDFILADFHELQRILFDPQSTRVIMSAMEATWWLNDHLQEWLGETNAADTLTQSVPDNVTSEMGLELLDVADVIRPHADVVDFLGHVEGDDFLDELATREGGREARDAIHAYLEKYGMRCIGEIDITRPRWSERPGTLVPLLLSNVRNFEAGEGARRFERGRREGARKEQEVLSRLRELPDGERKADETKQAIDRVRTFAGYREYPKYAMVSRYFIYKKSLLQEAERLVQANVIRETEDVYFLTLHELRDAVRTQRVNHALIRERRDAFRSYEALTPPRVLTSDGEAVVGSYRRDDLPAGALVGLAVSAGTVEGRARVILNIEDADFEADDILVTAFTDPGWTPLFVSVKGLVTEVGGLMTHGAVIAREYGLPAVVGVENATRLIRDGQRIRVNGTDGYVELM